MNWMDHGMGWGWPGMMLFWVVSVLLIIVLVNSLAALMEGKKESEADCDAPEAGASKKRDVYPVARLKRLRRQFSDWRQANAAAHAKSKAGACCSAPPPGAESRHSHGNGLR